MTNQVIPVMRIFDYAKALEFYINWLGFKIDWEHRQQKDSPVYLQISKDDILLHLTEHHGDCSPGAKVFIEFLDLKKYHQELLAKKYKYNLPALKESPWNAMTMEVTDPFLNKLLFNNK